MKKKIFIALLLFSSLFCLTSCREVHFFTTTDEGLHLEYTEIWNGEEFSGKVIMNKITFNGQSYELKKNVLWNRSEISYPEGDITISGKTLTNLTWQNGDAWYLDCLDQNIMFGEDILASIQFGWCNCYIDNKPNRVFIVATKTYLGSEGGGIGGQSYLATPVQLDYLL